MQKNGQFSVLMSVYKNDNALYFKEALQSVFAQTLPPAQTVVVADGPLTPQHEEVLNLFKDACTVVRLPENKGLGAALQEGLKHCSFELVARMDSDDICAPQRFALQVDAFEKDKDLTIIGGAIEEINAQTGQTVAFRILPAQDAEIKQFLKTRCPFNHMSVMFKKSPILACGGYVPMFLMEDYYLWARCAAKGFKMANLKDILVKARINENSYMRRGSYKYFKSNRDFYRKMLDLNLINYPVYLFNLAVRFSVQVLLPNSLRGLFYRSVLR